MIRCQNDQIDILEESTIDGLDLLLVPIINSCIVSWILGSVGISIVGVSGRCGLISAKGPRPPSLI